MKFKNKKNTKTGRRELPSKPKVFSYYSSAAPQSRSTSPYASTADSRKADKTTRIKSLVRELPAIISILVIAGSCLFATTIDANTVSINVVSVLNANQAVDTTAYENYISQQLSRSILNQNKFSINTQAVEEQILQAFPELSGVAITIPLVSRQTVVALSFEQPALVLGSSTTGYVVNDGGRVFGEAAQLPRPILQDVPVVEDKALVPLQIGELAIPTDLVAFVKSVSKHAEQSNLVVSSLLLPATANELHVQLKDQPYIIKLNTERSARVQMGSYLAYIGSQAEQGWVAPTDYIDVRVAGKVFVK